MRSGHVTSRLERLGWQAKTTPQSGDFGADVVAVCGAETLVVQCKRYKDASYLPFKAVQEAVFAKLHFSATACAIIYSGRLSQRSEQAARKHGVFTLGMNALTPGCDLDRSKEGSLLRKRASAKALMAQHAAWDDYEEAKAAA